MQSAKLAILVLFSGGCALSPIPKDIAQQRTRAHEQRQKIEHLLRPGDLIFRQGNARVAGGKVNFSSIIARISDSDFSHAVVVYRIVNGEAVIPDISDQGLQRFFLIDWLMDGQKNIVVKRLKPEYSSYLPLVMKEIDKLVNSDPLYDDKFGKSEDGRFYCTEAVDYCFRKAGLPLADKIPIRQLPNFHDMRIFASLVAAIIDVNLDTPVVVAGNEKIGLFSSTYLQTIIDLRPP